MWGSPAVAGVIPIGPNSLCSKLQQKTMGFFDKLKQGLAKTGRLLKTDVRDLFKDEGRLIDEPFLDEMRAILFKTDMGYDAVEQIVAEVAKNFRGRVVTL